MDMIVHQTKTNNNNGVIRSEPAETKCNAVHSRDELLNRSEEDIILQPFCREVIEMLGFHNFRFVQK